MKECKQYVMSLIQTTGRLAAQKVKFPLAQHLFLVQLNSSASDHSHTRHEKWYLGVMPSHFTKNWTLKWKTHSWRSIKNIFIQLQGIAYWFLTLCQNNCLLTGSFHTQIYIQLKSIIYFSKICLSNIYVILMWLAVDKSIIFN